jgi:hypothetical protein
MKTKRIIRSGLSKVENSEIMIETPGRRNGPALHPVMTQTSPTVSMMVPARKKARHAPAQSRCSTTGWQDGPASLKGHESGAE